MIAYAPDGSRRQVFGLFDSSTPIPRHGQYGATISHSGERISFEGAAGLPAFMRGVRLISETAAGMPFMVFRGYGEDRKPQPKAPQLPLLRRPNPDCSPFTVWSYVYASLLRGNAYIYKIKVGGRVKFLYPVNPACVTPDYEGSSPMFELRDREYGPVVDKVGKDQIIHIPGILLTDPYVGVGVVEAHRHGIGNELGRQRFEGRFIYNDSTPSAILRHTGPGSPTPEQRQEIRNGYESRHMGAGNAGRTGMVWGGWEIDQLPVNMQDAQFIESKGHGVQDIGRMLGIPSGLLNDPNAPGGDSPEQENMRLYTHGVKPWQDRVELGLVCDTDLFPQPDWEVRADPMELLRADIQTRFNAYRLARQGGWAKPNEIRGWEGLEDAEGGDEIQQTPVGGAPNNQSGGGAGDANAE